MSKYALLAALPLLLGSILPAQAAEPEATAGLEKTLEELLPGVTPDSITPAPVRGLYEVVIGPRLFYMTGDGRYLVQGSLIDLVEQTDVTEQRRSAIRLAAVEAVGEENMIVFSPETPRHTVTVFTDPDCPYCQRMHDEIDEMKRLGIKVRYLLYPRAGVGSASYQKTVAAWCADDRQKAITDAKAGRELEARTCENPVEAHMALGQMMGISGTPTLVFEDGRVLPGYMPAAQLSEMLEEGR
jgi:thiol:disulfide interchange protein DsbC